MISDIKIIDFGEAKFPRGNQQEKFQLGVVRDYAQFTIFYVVTVLHTQHVVEQRTTELSQKQVRNVYDEAERLSSDM